MTDKTAKELLMEIAERFVENGGKPVTYSLATEDGKTSLTYMTILVDAEATEDDEESEVLH